SSAVTHDECAVYERFSSWARCGYAWFERTRSPGTGRSSKASCRSRTAGSPPGVRTGAGPPPLADIGKRLALDSFRATVRSGKSEMPAFPRLDDAALKGLYEYLGGLEAASSPVARETPRAAARPVVA